MMRANHLWKKAALALSIGALVAPVCMAQGYGNTGVQQNRNTPPAQQPIAPAAAKTKSGEKAALFPNTTRSEPKLAVSSNDIGEQLTKLQDKINTGKDYDEAIAMGAKIASTYSANRYDKALAYQAIGIAYINKGDTAKGLEYLQKTLTENALPNNEHYSLMLQVAKSQIGAGQADAGLATLDRLIAETKQDKPEYAALRGRVFYERKDYAAAAPILQKTLDAGGQQDPAVAAMLMTSYYQLKQPDRAAKLGQDILSAHPDDKRAILNLAAAYQQAGQNDQAATLLDGARKRGQLADANDYRQLYALYSTLKGHENDSIAVINEGLQKGILQPKAEVFTALAEDYYFSNQIPQAIVAYAKADAASTDGEASLNLAKIYNNQGRANEAKGAAERALQKGVKKPEEARAMIDHAAPTAKVGKKK